MNVCINGEKREIAARTTVDELLVQLDVDRRQVAVERNRQIVPKTDYAQAELTEGDELEIVTFVGGG